MLELMDLWGIFFITISVTVFREFLMYYKEKDYRRWLQFEIKEQINDFKRLGQTFEARMKRIAGTMGDIEEPSMTQQLLGTLLGSEMGQHMLANFIDGFMGAKAKHEQEQPKEQLKTQPKKPKKQ